MSDKPTTDRVRASYMIDGHPDTYHQRVVEFDEWLATVEREAAAKALEFVARQYTDSDDAADTLLSLAAEYREGRR